MTALPVAACPAGSVVAISRDIHFETTVRNGCAERDITPSVVRWCGRDVREVVEEALALQPHLVFVQYRPGEGGSYDLLRTEFRTHSEVTLCVLGAALVRKVGPGRRIWEYFYPTEQEVRSALAHKLAGRE